MKSESICLLKHLRRTLVVHFEYLKPRPIKDLLNEAAFSASFIEKALHAAVQKEIHQAQGIALLFDFDYQAKRSWKSSSGPLTFLGTFPYARPSWLGKRPQVRDPQIEIRNLEDDIL
jgi:hypothetical protein